MAHQIIANGVAFVIVVKHVPEQMGAIARAVCMHHSGIIGGKFMARARIDITRLLGNGHGVVP